MVRMRLAALIAALTCLQLSACRNKYWTSTMPDHHPGYGIRCQGSMAICYRRAAKLCPQGYTIYYSKQKFQVPADQVHAGSSTPLPYYWKIYVSCGMR